MSGTGFGIAGHKNSYSTSVRCGNWVEDSIGHELAQHRGEPAMEYTTESRRNYVDPRTMAEHPSASRVTIPSLAEITVKSREGLSWNVMFAHGEEQEAKQKYSTTNAAQFRAYTEEGDGDEVVEGIAGRQRTLEREKRLRQEEREVRIVLCFRWQQYACQSNSVHVLIRGCDCLDR